MDLIAIIMHSLCTDGGPPGTALAPLPRVDIVDDNDLSLVVKRSGMPAKEGKKAAAAAEQKKMAQKRRSTTPAVDPNLATGDARQLATLGDPDALHCICQTKYNPKK